MSKRMAVLSSLLFATILLSPLASADVTEETIYFSSITSYELEDIVISGYVEPNVETIGRVCYPDCGPGNEDRYDFWYLNASIGTRLEVSFTTINEPDFVSLDVEYCFLDERNYTTFHCRFWHKTGDENDDWFTKTLDNVYCQYALRISPNNGLGGDDTTYEFEFSIDDNPEHVTDIFNKHSFIEEPVNTTFTIEDSVCWFTCDEYNSMDLYDIYLVKGDTFGFELTSLYNESNEFDRGILHVYVMEINEYYSTTRTLTEYRMNEQDSLTVGVQETESVVLRVKVAIKDDSNSGDHLGIRSSSISTTRMRLIPRHRSRWLSRLGQAFMFLRDISRNLDKQRTKPCGRIHHNFQTIWIPIFCVTMWMMTSMGMDILI